MPSDSFVLRLTKDEDGREVVYQNTFGLDPGVFETMPPWILLWQVFYPGVDEPEALQLWSPNPDSDEETPDDMVMRAVETAQVTIARTVMRSPAGTTVRGAWYRRHKVSKISDEEAAHPHVIRGAQYVVDLSYSPIGVGSLPRPSEGGVVGEAETHLSADDAAKEHQAWKKGLGG